MRRKSCSRLKCIMMKRNKLSVIMKSEDKCVPVWKMWKELEKASQNTYSLLHPSEFWEERRVLASWAKAAGKGGGCCGTCRSVYCWEDLLGSLVTPSPHRALAALLSVLPLLSLHTGAGGGAAVLARGAPLCCPGGPGCAGGCAGTRTVFRSS